MWITIKKIRHTGKRMLENKHEYNFYKKQFYLLKNLLNYNNCEFHTDFHKYLSELDWYNDLSYKCTYYCHS